ncbi:GlxA family transcriptional regulator [Motiliproteus sp.]|uniref:GlxA family transcriptional regulator n=1 Tax=Motiliproteus sp. TaxID=1898955 RepID=UPI003BAAD4F1
MQEQKDKRHFSDSMRHTNSAFLPADQTPAELTRVGFVLQEHFSLMAFTAAVDALVTANLVRSTPLFEFSTYGMGSLTVKSDLGINISTNARIDQLPVDSDQALQMLIVCGGFRCSLRENSVLTQKLKAVARSGTVLGALWNGTVPLAQAGLLDEQECALHPDNHAFMREHFPKVRLSDQVCVITEGRATSAGPSSALDMMLALIERSQGRDTVRAIREILNSDQMAENRDQQPLQSDEEASFPEPLKDLLQLMESNIEEPLSIDELASLAGVSRRQVERLFQSHLSSSPSRYYLELRITHARRLLLQGSDSIANIALASGFVSSTHFSHCYKDYFGLSPSQARQQKSTCG